MFEVTQESPFKSSPNGMDSREIAQRTGKLHKNVCRDILEMIQKLNLDRLKFESVYMAGNGERRRCFILPERELWILATGYDVFLRARILDRWKELEAGFKIPQTFLEAMQLATSALEQKAAAETALEAAMPAVLAQKRLAGAEGLVGIRETAKRLGWPPKAFVALMVAGKHLFYEGKKLQARADHLAAGRFQMVTGVKEIKEGHDHEYGQVKFTGTGIDYFTKKMPEYIAPPKKPRKSRAKKKDAT